MPEEKAIRGAIGALKGQAILGDTYYRSIPERFKTTPLEWAPSFQDGNRYNPKGEFAALYLAGTERLAEKEVEGRLKPQYQEPRAMLSFRISLKNVLDLTSEDSVSGLGNLALNRKI